MRSSQLFLLLLPVLLTGACEGQSDSLDTSSDLEDNISERQGLRPIATREEEVTPGGVESSSFDASDDGRIVTVRGPAYVYHLDLEAKYLEVSIEETDFFSQVAFQVAWKTPGFNEWRQRSFSESDVTIACDSRFYSGAVGAKHFNSITVDRSKGQITANVVGASGCEHEITFQTDDAHYVQEFRVFPVPIWEPGDISGEFNFALTSSSF